VFRTPDASPVPSSPIPACVLATDATPSPAPMTTKAAVIGASAARRTAPAAIAASPAGIARATLGEASDPAITATFKGAKRRPSLLCAWRTARNIAGEVVPVSASATRAPRASPGVRRVPGGSSGCGELRWMRAKAISSSRPAASGATASAETPSSARLRPTRSAARPSVSAAAPGRSSRRCSRPRTSGSSRPASAAPASPIGTLTAKTHSQPGPLLITPPSTQPDAPPPAAAAVQTASARERAGPSGSVATNRASADGATSAAPVPCTARAAISAPALGASAQAAEAAVKISRPARNARRRP
jgi:hypothetical protein